MIVALIILGTSNIFSFNSVKLLCTMCVFVWSLNCARSSKFSQFILTFNPTWLDIMLFQFLDIH